MLQKVTKRHRSTTVMALEVCISLYGVNVTPCFILVLLRVATNGTTKVVEI